MHKKAIIVLALAAVGLGAGSVFLSGRSGAGPSGVKSTPSGKPLLLPTLAKSPQTIASVQLLRDGKSLSLVRTPQGWVLPEKGNYPALEEPVAKLVRGLLAARVLESKTSDPTLYERLSVQDPPAVGSASGGASGVASSPSGVTPVLVSLLGEGQAPLAKVILGKAQQSATVSAETAASFARESGSAQSVLISGSFTAPIDAMQWVERNVLEIDRARFASVRVQGPAGAPALVVSRKSESEESYQVADMPEGRELKDTTTPQRVVTPLSSLTIDDVLPVASLAMDDADKAFVSTFTTFDGLVLTARTIDHEGKPWVSIHATYDAALDTKAPPAADATLATHREQQQKNASAMHARLSPWAFQIPAFVAEQLRASMESLLKPLPGNDPPTADGTLPSDPGAEPNSPAPATQP
jgi:hypothetical protein